MTWERSPRLFRLILALLLSFTLAFGVMAQQSEDASAYSTGFGLGGCSYASGWCYISISMHCASQLTIIWYTYRSGYYATDTTYFSPGWAGDGWEYYHYIHYDERADYVTVNDNGTGCLAGAYLLGPYW